MAEQFKYPYDEQAREAAFRDTARRALRLNGKADFFQVLKELDSIMVELSKVIPLAKLPTHPIVQLLVQKMANISCPKRDLSYYQLERIVKDLAHVEE